MFLLLTGCGNNAVNSDSDSIPIKDSAIVVYDTSYHIDGNHTLMMEIRRNDSLTSRSVYRNESDTLYYSDGCIKEVDLGHTEDFERMYFLYGHDKILRFKYTSYSRDGMGGEVADRWYYDTTGILIRQEYNKDYMPPDAEGHLDVCGVITTTEYFPNGKVKSIKKTDNHYEGGYYCPCGSWEYFDSGGAIIRKENYQKCGEGNTDCEEMF